MVKLEELRGLKLRGVLKKRYYLGIFPPPPGLPLPPPPSGRPSRLVRVIRRSDGHRVSFLQLDGVKESEVKGGGDVGEGVNGPKEVHDQDLTGTGDDFEGSETYRDESECSEIDWEEIDRRFEEKGLPGQS